MTVVYHPAARAELRRAVRWYERRRPGLGLAFFEAVRAAEDYVRDHPQIGAPLREPNRRYVVQRFPYGLIYRIEDDSVFILAVAHLRRRPDYWRGRE